ncbi:MAG: HAD family phosphatase [Chloroflexi bacterium]|nr:HAD family phosphatase [Chloroflexota bacterium]
MPQLRDYQAVVFDMDGTLTPNMHLHEQAFAVFMQKYNIPTPDAQVAASLSGKRNSEIFPVLFGRELLADELNRYADEKEELYRTLMEHVHPVAGLYDFLRRLDEHQLKSAIATSAPHGNVGPTLERLNLPDYFGAITLGVEVANGKPAPDIFIEAARRLGAAAEQCIGIEDSFAGLTAVRAAGMYTVAIATTHTAEELAMAKPDIIVADYVELLNHFA